MRKKSGHSMQEINSTPTLKTLDMLLLDRAVQAVLAPAFLIFTGPHCWHGYAAP